MRLDGEAAARGRRRPFVTEPAAQQRVDRRLERSVFSTRIFLQQYGRVGVQRHGRSHLDIMMLAISLTSCAQNAATAALLGAGWRRRRFQLSAVSQTGLSAEAES
jgi:hypothetical protein